jgi:hypothetical protein
MEPHLLNPREYFDFGVLYDVEPLLEPHPLRVVHSAFTITTTIVDHHRIDHLMLAGIAIYGNDVAYVTFLVCFSTPKPVLTYNKARLETSEVHNFSFMGALDAAFPLVPLS